MKRSLYFILNSFLSICIPAFAAQDVHKISIVGGGIAGALEAYSAFQDAQKNGEKVSITVYDKGDCFKQSTTNTAFNIVPSLTIDEILSVVPRGNELIEKLAIPFNQPGGIRVDDVPGVNDSESAQKFKEAVVLYGQDKDHDNRTLALLKLGKKSMELWQQMYDEGDAELKAIMETSNFNPCREPKNLSEKKLHDGYRIDLIYGIKDAYSHAETMKASYEKMGYKNCKVLSPEEVSSIDPYLADFCSNHSEEGVWMNDAAALWRPGGCIDTHLFLPKLYTYLQKHMGDDFQLKSGYEAVSINFDPNTSNVIGLKFANGLEINQREAEYVFCPGEAVGTLHNFGFHEPAYAGFAGPVLILTIPLSEEQKETYQNFSHCMEVHKVGIVLAWQARMKDGSLVIGAAGTKAFYGDKLPHKDEAFAKNRNLVQLNMMNDVLPEMVSLAFGFDTHGKVFTEEDLAILEEKGLAHRWVGRRAVAYDGFPTLGSLYCHEQKVKNARCTTHLGSGGISFGPGAVWVSRASKEEAADPLVQEILMYANSKRTP